MSKSHDGYAINEEMASNYTELLFSLERDPTMILLAQDDAPEIKNLFYAKTKLSTFVNFEVYGLKMMMMKKIAV